MYPASDATQLTRTPSKPHDAASRGFHSIQFGIFKRVSVRRVTLPARSVDVSANAHSFTASQEKRQRGWKGSDASPERAEVRESSAERKSNTHEYNRPTCRCLAASLADDNSCEK